MEDTYWLNKWKINDIAFHEENINADLIAYANKLNLKQNDCVLVPLCGKTKDMLWLAQQGFHVIGIELSPIACQDFFKALNVTPHMTKQLHITKYQYNSIELLCGDLFNLTRKDFPTIHAVYDCKALIALPPDLRKKYVDHITTCTGTKIKILLLGIDTNCQVNPPPFPIGHTEVNLLYGSSFDIELLKRLTITDLPEKLIKKGYAEMTESVYLMSDKSV